MFKFQLHHFSTLQRPLLLGISVGMCAATLAQAPRERPRYVLQALDLDQDGKLSAQEIQLAPASLLKLDRNGDGELTPDEMEPPRTDAGADPDQLTAQLMAFDKNGDGVLTPEELPDRMRPLFARADANHDGKLTRDEIRQMAAHTGAANGPRRGPGSADGPMRLDPVLSALDVDHDGVLSPAELRVSTASLLTLDRDHDGAIAASEMRVRRQTPQERTAHLLEEWDTDKDGRISHDEAPDGMRAHFADADTNGDGYLDETELLRMYNAQAASTGRAPEDAAQPKGPHD